MKNFGKSILAVCICSIISLALFSCSDSNSLSPEFEAPRELPEGLQTGTPLGDAQMSLYEDLGVITYINPETTRFIQDLVSDQTVLNLSDATPPDSSAAMLAIEMARIFYEELPQDKKNLMPRNLYFIKQPTFSGSGYSEYIYEAYLWYNSSSDVTIGNLNSAELDTTQLKGAFYYGLSSILRSFSRNATLYTNFQEAADEAGYYFYVYDEQTAYENGFVTSNQSKIRGQSLDFDTYASWAVTTPPEERQAILDQYGFVSQKYQIVRSMFMQEGIDLEAISEKWQDSPLNPANN